MRSPPSTPSPHGSPVETVRKIAALARLELAPAEEEVQAGHFERILRQFEVLAQLDVPAVDETEGAALGPSRTTDVLRDDVPRPCLPAEALLGNAPAHTTEFYSVPKTVGGEP